jgi:hypothetical protein
MYEAPFDPTEGERAELQVVVGEIERELRCLGREAPIAEHRTAVLSLIASWSRLVELMSLGVAPAVRFCPSCGCTAPLLAIRCDQCWIGLPAKSVERPASH